MEVHEVNAETFKSIKELAEIQGQIANGRAELQTLKQNHENYLAEREKDTAQRVKATLEASQEALSEAEKNRDALTSYLSAAKELVASIKELGDALNSESEHFETACGEIFAEIDRKTADIEAAKKDLISQRVHVESERKVLDAQKRAFGEEKKRIYDIRDTTNRKIERLKANRI